MENEFESKAFTTNKPSRFDFVEFIDPIDGFVGKYEQMIRSTQVTNENELRNCMRHEDAKTKIAIIHQLYSWSPLQISKTMFQLFQALVNGTDEIWDMVLSFRAQTSSMETAFSICSWKPRDETHEICYTFKYPERKKTDEGFSWVIRQTGVYHKYDSVLEKSIWLLLFPNPEAASIDDITKYWREDNHPLQPHLCLQLAKVNKWRFFIAHFEKEFLGLEMEFLSVDSKGRLEFQSMFERMSNLRSIETNLCPMIPILSKHRMMLHTLSKFNEELLARGEISQDTGWEFAVDLDNLHTKLQALELSARFFIDRVSSITQMASDTISLKSQNTTEDISHQMVRDSAAIRVITVMTLIYLPASFVSGFFGMGFFSVDTQGAQLIAFSSIWVYFAVAIPLSILTLVYWRWKSRLEKKKRSDELLV